MKAIKIQLLSLKRFAETYKGSSDSYEKKLYRRACMIRRKLQRRK